MPSYIVPLRHDRRPLWATVDFDIFPVTDTMSLTDLLDRVAEPGTLGHLDSRTINERVHAVKAILDNEYGNRSDGAQISVSGTPHDGLQTVVDIEYTLTGANVFAISVFACDYEPVHLYHAWLGRDLDQDDDRERFGRACDAVDDLNQRIENANLFE